MKSPEIFSCNRLKAGVDPGGVGPVWPNVPPPPFQKKMSTSSYYKWMFSHSAPNLKQVPNFTTPSKNFLDPPLSERSLVTLSFFIIANRIVSDISQGSRVPHSHLIPLHTLTTGVKRRGEGRDLLTGRSP